MYIFAHNKNHYQKLAMKISLKTIALALGLAATANLYAEDVALILSLSDGKTATYVLSDKPVVTFDDDHIIFTSSEASASHLRAEVTDITFRDSQSGLADFTNEENVMRYVNHTVEAPGQTIRVYSVDGRLTATGNGSLSLDGLANGIYIATAGTQTLKIKL